MYTREGGGKADQEIDELLVEAEVADVGQDQVEVDGRHPVLLLRLGLFVIG